MTTTPLTQQQLKALLSPLQAERVKTRKGGGGMTLSYVEGWDIRAMLTRVFGFGGWDWTVLDVKPIGNGFFVHGRLHIKQTDTTWDGVGHGTMGAPDDQVKTAVTEALKNAAQNLGDAAGLSLYNKGSMEPVIGFTLAPEQVKTLFPDQAE
jgi:recombination DNA repair RAD52 pathway protein